MHARTGSGQDADITRRCPGVPGLRRPQSDGALPDGRPFPPTLIRPNGPVRGRFAAGLLALVVLMLVAFNLLTTQAIRGASERAHAFGLASDAFSDARFAASEEQSLEWEYWTAPSPEVRARLAAAATRFEASLRSILALESSQGGLDPRDRPAILVMLTNQATYLAAVQTMFDAEDAGNAALAHEIDAQTVDPAIDQLVENGVGEEAVERRRGALAALGPTSMPPRTSSPRRHPVVFGVGLALLALFLLVLQGLPGTRYRRRRSAVPVARPERVGRRRDRGRAGLWIDLHQPCRGAGGPRAWAPEALAGTNVLALVHEEDAAAVAALLRQAGLAPGDPITIEIRLAIAADDVRDFEVIATSLLADASVRGIVLHPPGCLRAQGIRAAAQTPRLP